MTIMDDSNSHDLFDPRFEYQGGRLFIVGTVPQDATESNWVLGCQGAVAWDRVTDYYIFDSAEAFTKAINVSENHQKIKSDNAKS